jgi:UDP-sugar transporter A1/2/3
MAVATRRASAPARAPSSAATGTVFCVLLALQYGLQPFLKVFVAPDVNKLSLVLSTEVAKILIACGVMAFEGSFATHFAGWNARAASLSVLPSLIYAAQNYLLVVGYQSMDSVTFNCLNQSKLVSTALFVYLLFGTRQSYPQMLALAGLLVAGVALQEPSGSLSSPSEKSSAISSATCSGSGARPQR